MPKIVDGWGASGARVLVDAHVQFAADQASESEVLVGPLETTRVLTAQGGGRIVTFEGEQVMTFKSGGWCVQRPLFSKPTQDEGLLRFWLDCPSGCAKNDVSVPPGERLFFSTGVWDSTDAMRAQRAKAVTCAENLKALEAEGAEGGSNGGDLLTKIPVFGPVRRQVLREEKLAALRRSQAYYASFPGLDAEGMPALIATKGSLSLKSEPSAAARWKPRGYIYLGKFDAEPLQ